jgi:hypothetical protein
LQAIIPPPIPIRLAGWAGLTLRQIKRKTWRQTRNSPPQTNAAGCSSFTSGFNCKIEMFATDRFRASSW